MEPKQVKDLMEAYASIYSEISESHFKVGDEVTCKKSGMEGEIIKVDPEQTGKYYTVKRDDGKTMKYAPDELRLEKEEMEEKKEKEEKEEKEDEMKEEVDLFDYLLEYLVAEGYADTNKAALAIMVNMSEEWKQDIVEAKYGTKAGRKALAKKIRKGEEIGKSGPGTGFEAVKKAAKEGGARDPEAVAAAAMWKTHGGKKG